MAVLWSLTEVFGVYSIVSESGEIVVASFWNYLLNSWWIWKE